MEKYITLTEACEIIGLSRQSLFYHMKVGNLKFYKPKGSRAIRFTEDMIIDFMSSGSPAGKRT